MTIKEAKSLKRLTVQDLREIDSEMLPPQVAAKALKCNPYSINVQAHTDASKLGFPVTIIRRRVTIPRLALIRHLEGGGA